jgi:subtilase family serine protease
MSGPHTGAGSSSPFGTGAPQTSIPVCSSATSGNGSCHALILADAKGNALSDSRPTPFEPADLRRAYSLPSTGGNGAWVALVDASDDPNAEADLAVYRKQFGLPPCTTANGCFKKLNQQGQQGNYPQVDKSWSVEISLDLDMVSATCPNCNIMLVEANSPSLGDFGEAENTAAAAGATVISNSWGSTREDPALADFDNQYFNHPGIAIFASSGDQGFGVSYPATSPNVTAVGGTTLNPDSSFRGFNEIAWGSTDGANGGGGSGCSSVFPKPNWQTDTGCSNRMEVDVSAIADPNSNNGSGIPVYVSDGLAGGQPINGWLGGGGTSMAAPIVAAIYALTGHGSDGPSLSYRHPEAFWDVVTGTNGTCSVGYECNSTPGYDGPTGNGTPNAGTLANIPAGG